MIKPNTNITNNISPGTFSSYSATKCTAHRKAMSPIRDLKLRTTKESPQSKYSATIILVKSYSASTNIATFMKKNEFNIIMWIFPF